MRTIDLRGNRLPSNLKDLLPRPQIDTTAAVETVRPLVEQVRDRGAAALYELDERFDGVRPPALRVSSEQMRRALADLDPEVVEALRVAIANARVAHRAQMPVPSVTEVLPGGIVSQRWVPLGRVGLYVPGGLAVYPSSVVMNVVAAQVAGVGSMVVATPPQKDFDGLPHPVTLAACALLGVDEVIAVGGAQAIAALAYGFVDEPGPTGDGAAEKAYVCRPVDKVTGPGNVYVAAAKRLVQSVCGIDSEAGTTEIAILADSSANPTFVAADLVSQAEHDPAAASVLVTDSADLAEEVRGALNVAIDLTENKERIRLALGGPQSAIVLVDTVEAGVQVVQAYAPEHLEIQTSDPLAVSEQITTAGAVFLGDYTPVPLGDYVAGSNHVLPTGGTARHASGLNVTQFLRSMQVVDYSPEALRALTPSLVTLAEAEGLPAHGQAALIRFGADVPAPAPQDDADEVRLPWRTELEDVEPYGAPMIDVPVRLNVNENPFPPRPEVVDAIAEAVRSAAWELNRYADRDAEDLRRDLADYVNSEADVDVDWTQVWAANGSNEVMLELLQAFGGPGRTALSQWPTYSMYEEYARDTNTGWCLVDTNASLRDRAENLEPLPDTLRTQEVIPKFDPNGLIDAMRATRPAVVFISNPNNPTGQWVSREDLNAVLEASRELGPRDRTGNPRACLVVVDEAYAEFRADNQPSAIDLLDDFPHLVVTRTLSKAFAAAGLRLGYLVASPRIVEEVQKVRLPYHLSLITQAAARASLRFRGQHADQVDLIRRERDEMEHWLRERGFEVAPSAANFLFFGPLPDRHRVWEGLVERGVLIREVGPPGYLRVTVGTPEENRRFQAALGEVL